jgi:hypothetical protein
VTILGGIHMGFTDAPPYLTPLGRDVIGPVSGIGSISLADMTTMTGDTISAFVGPALGVNNERRIPLHPTIRTERSLKSPDDAIHRKERVNDHLRPAAGEPHRTTAIPAGHRDLGGRHDPVRRVQTTRSRHRPSVVAYATLM